MFMRSVFRRVLGLVALMLLLVAGFTGAQFAKLWQAGQAPLYSLAICGFTVFAMFLIAVELLAGNSPFSRDEDEAPPPAAPRS